MYVVMILQFLQAISSGYFMNITIPYNNTLCLYNKLKVQKYGGNQKLFEYPQIVPFSNSIER